VVEEEIELDPRPDPTWQGLVPPSCVAWNDTCVIDLVTGVRDALVGRTRVSRSVGWPME
jgi:hypothetical protein